MSYRRKTWKYLCSFCICKTYMSEYINTGLKEERLSQDFLRIFFPDTTKQSYCTLFTVRNNITFCL